MTYLPYILITPLVWFFLVGFFYKGSQAPEQIAIILATILTLALWGVLLLVIN